MNKYLKKALNYSQPRSILNNSVKLLTLSCSLLLLTTVNAAKNDLEEEITIKAQRQSADLKNKIASYLDDVRINQGSISISADVVKVFSTVNKKNGSSNDTYLAKGKPAIFQQKLEDGNLILLQANEITYTPDTHTITVSGNALVKQAGSEVSGDVITFNTLSEKLEAKSTNNEAITTILQPTILKNQKEAQENAKIEKAVKSASAPATEAETDKGGESSDN